MTNQEIYDLWQKGEAILTSISQADWDIEWQKPTSSLSHEAIIKYKNKHYYILFQDKNCKTLISMPNELATEMPENYEIQDKYENLKAMLIVGMDVDDIRYPEIAYNFVKLCLEKNITDNILELPEFGKIVAKHKDDCPLVTAWLNQ